MCVGGLSLAVPPLAVEESFLGLLSEWSVSEERGGVRASDDYGRVLCVGAVCGQRRGE